MIIFTLPFSPFRLARRAFCPTQARQNDIKQQKQRGLLKFAFATFPAGFTCQVPGPALERWARRSQRLVSRDAYSFNVPSTVGVRGSPDRFIRAMCVLEKAQP